MELTSRNTYFNSCQADKAAAAIIGSYSSLHIAVQATKQTHKQVRSLVHRPQQGTWADIAISPTLAMPLWALCIQEKERKRLQISASI